MSDMANNSNDQQAGQPATLKSQLKRFKFMTNITKGAMHQTKYMKSLEKVTMDAQVSYNRLFISMCVVFGLVILYFNFAFSGAKTAYVFLPSTLVLIGSLIIVVNYLVSSRTKSMMATALQLVMHPFLEKARRATKKQGDLKSLGIKTFNKGVIRFDEGDYGVIYKINGVLSLSALQVQPMQLQTRNCLI